MIFYYATKGSNKCTKILYIYYYKFEVVTFKLNVPKYISLKASYVVVVKHNISWTSIESLGEMKKNKKGNLRKAKEVNERGLKV